MTVRFKKITVHGRCGTWDGKRRCGPGTSTAVSSTSSSSKSVS